MANYIRDNWVVGFYLEGYHGRGSGWMSIPHLLENRVDPNDPHYPDWINSYVIQCHPQAIRDIGDSWYPREIPGGHHKLLFGYYVHDNDKMAVQHAVNWDNLALGPSADLTYERKSNGERMTVPVLHRRLLYRRPAAEPAGTFKLPKAAEAKAVKQIKKQFRAGLLETIYVMFRHWENHVEMSERFNPALIEDEQQRQSLIQMNNTNVADSKKNAETISVEYLKIQDDLDRSFNNANTLRQTFAICNRYVAGEFGKDWHLRHYWNGKRSPWHRKTADTVLDNRNHVLEKHRVGYSDNYFGEDFIRPLFKRHPKLALIYHVMTESELSAHQQTTPVIPKPPAAETPSDSENDDDDTENNPPDNSILGG